MNQGRERERGLTLTELTVTMVLAVIVMTGLVVFYLNSQAVWMDGSAQAITQREATLVVNEIANRARGASLANFYVGPPAILTLKMGNQSSKQYEFKWDSDLLLYETYTDASGNVFPRGPVLQSRVSAFRVGIIGGMVYDTLTVQTPQGSLVTLASSAAMINLGAN